MARILVACEFSGVVRSAFRALGHDAWSCDLLPAEDGGPHLLGDVCGILHSGWDLMIAHPPCTYLSNSGVRHLHSVPTVTGKLPAIHGKERWQAMWNACTFFLTLKTAQIAKICVENPVPHGYARAIIGPYTQIIQPFEFGHGEKKKTCLWLSGLPALIPTDIVAGREARVHREAPGPDRWKRRSTTYTGVAAAMADQWGWLA